MHGVEKSVGNLSVSFYNFSYPIYIYTYSQKIKTKNRQYIPNIVCHQGWAACYRYYIRLLNPMIAAVDFLFLSFKLV